jgi:hypothetical protein
MDMDWLAAIQAEEEESIPLQVCENRWHAFIYPASMGRSTCFSLSRIVELPSPSQRVCLTAHTLML